MSLQARRQWTFSEINYCTNDQGTIRKYLSSRNKERDAVSRIPADKLSPVTNISVAVVDSTDHTCQQDEATSAPIVRQTTNITVRFTILMLLPFSVPEPVIIQHILVKYILLTGLHQRNYKQKSSSFSHFISFLDHTFSVLLFFWNTQTSFPNLQQHRTWIAILFLTICVLQSTVMHQFISVILPSSKRNWIQM
jgi:hypothetical protein